MIYHVCGGKLIVYDTIQSTLDGKVFIRRMRRCNQCGAIVSSIEYINDAKIKSDYHHSSYTGDGIKKEVKKRGDNS